MDRRQFLLASSAAALAGGLPLSAGAFERVGERKTLVFSGSQPVPLLDPHVKYDWSTRMMQQCLYDALCKYEGNPPKIVPWLAEKWETSTDGLTWTFHLVAGAKFHNGDPVDAAAVAFSYARGLRLNKGVAWMLKDHLDPAAIKVIDPRTVSFTLKQPYPAFLSFVPNWFIVNPRQAGGEDDGQKFLTDGDAGSGPFRIRRWDGQAVMALDAVADYWKGWPMGEKQRPAGVIYRVIREAAPRKVALQRGEVDMVAEMTPDDWAQLAKLPSVTVTGDAGMTPFTIQLNTAHGPTANRDFRKALAYALDYEALIAIENGLARLLDSPFPDAMTGHVAVEGMPRRDLGRAREYLARSKVATAGLELEYLFVAGLEAERRIGLALLESLQPLGIKVNVVGQPWPTLVARGAKAETTADLTATYITPVSTDPDVLASQYSSSSEGQYWGMHHLKDADLDRMVSAARMELDTKQRMRIYADIQRHIVDLQPAIFGMVEDRKWALRSYVKGFSFCPVRLTGEADLYPLYVAS